MIAVYYCYGIRQNKGKEGMVVVPVADDSFEAFMELIMERDEYPFPDTSILFIEGSEVVNRFHIHG